MALTGTVTSWKGPYGFAETDDGKLVYIHSTEIEGGKLRVGRKITFDTEEVDGHAERVKGVNVSGKGVLPKGEKLSDDEFAEDRKLLEEMREAAKGKNKEEYVPVKTLVDELNRSNKVHLVRELIKELKLQDSIRYKEEKRQDPTLRGGPKYTKAEFLAFYGPVDGQRMWQVAGQLGKKGGKGKKATKGSKKEE
eukprot:TRINITY_DN53790_c0_g1_i1.p2 TRINITY_DN53790_c0_g1~~TRINITY_DN53790_c0_g1_i1.p2  ORF type:complete len:210 (+),score=105.60 TRINITY_DN53790_c0_g1_i1:49-630(+)